MSEKLFESGNLIFNLNTLGTIPANEPETPDPASGWKNALVKRGFKANVIEKLDALGEPFKKALNRLGFDAEKNPLLAFVAQGDVQKDLLLAGLLNANTIKVLYNAIAHNLMADSEFFTQNSYNVIYCKDWYRKPLNVMMDYLKLQKNILKPDASSYPPEVQTRNQKVFFKDKATLNSIDFVEEALGKSADDAVRLAADNQDALVAALGDDKSLKHAVLSYLTLTTGSAVAKTALSSISLTGKDIAEAAAKINELKTKKLLPQGKINKADADVLATKILASLKK